MMSSKISFSVDVPIDPLSGLPCIDSAELYDILLARCQAENDRIEEDRRDDVPVCSNPSVDDRLIETITVPLFKERIQSKKVRRKTGEISIHKYIEEEVSESAIDVETDLIIIDIDAEESVVKSCLCIEGGRIVINLKPLSQFSSTSNDVLSLRDSTSLPISFGLCGDVLVIDSEVVIRDIVSIKKVANRSEISTKDVIRREEIDVRTLGDVNISYKN